MEGVREGGSGFMLAGGEGRWVREGRSGSMLGGVRG